VRRVAVARRLPRRVQLAAWIASFLLYAGYFQGQWAFGERPIFHITGDEPHYLTIATSLVKDWDLDIYNNYRDKDYFAFYPFHVGDARDPEDMHALYGRGGALFSKHGVGLPLLILPAMQLGGHGPATVFLMGIAALLSVHVLLLAWDCTHRATPTALAWLGVAWTPPLLLYAPLFYPELPGALLTIMGVRAALRLSRDPDVGRSSLGFVILVAVAVGLLPWLHLRYLPIAAVVWLAAVALALRARQWQAISILILLPGLLGGVLLALNWRLFGGVPPVDEYGTIALSHVLAGAPGLLLDRQFGLLPYSPVYLVPLLGVAAVGRVLTPVRTAIVLAPLAVYVAFISSFSYWYGAFSPPARMLVPVLPLLAAPAAVALARWQALRPLHLALLALTAAISRLLMDVPRLRYNLPDGDSAALEYLSRVWARDVREWLPSFIRPAPESYVWVACVLAFAVSLAYLAALRGGARFPRLPRPWFSQMRRVQLRKAE